ncbi:hypothetical protein CEE37_14380 [candidate division LCP-89 bacterium B3_LCP]|uniref:Uncharacterized protein n=1 Tax=candidate division LCP-89 bacterium B3_LCP TaxID=2012998 RepID=A0A532UPN5_UNCL8|nr:MAG: hypothetical protein CEE37_14380 [candidate division LCP-89 bacterium B3_LCP]
MPLLWIDKQTPKEVISANFELVVRLETQGTTNYLIFDLQSKNELYTIDGQRGSVFLVIPEAVQPLTDEMDIRFLDQDMEEIQGASFPNFEDLVQLIASQFVPSIGPIGMADITEAIFEEIGVGKLEEIIPGGVFASTSTFYEALAQSWDTIYKLGTVIQAHALQVKIPFNADLGTAEGTINLVGMGAFYNIDFTYTTSRVAVMFEELKVDVGSNSTLCPEIDLNLIANEIFNLFKNKEIAALASISYPCVGIETHGNSYEGEISLNSYSEAYAFYTRFEYEYIWNSVFYYWKPDGDKKDITILGDKILIEFGHSPGWTGFYGTDVIVEIVDGSPRVTSINILD